MANKQKASSGEKIIDVRRVTRDSKSAQRINFYGALGVSILVLVILAISTVLMMFMASASWYGPYSQLLEASAVVALLGIFICLPILLASKYGWRTVITTLLLQSVLLFITVFILSMFVPDNQNVVRPISGDTPGMVKPSL